MAESAVATKPPIDVKLRERLTPTERPVVPVVHTPATPHDQQRIAHFIEADHGRADMLAYRTLFALTGVDTNGWMAIPFLESDPYYNAIPMKKKVRFNFVYGHSQKPFIKDLQDRLPQVPLTVANMVDGLPMRDKSVDFLVLNHSILISMLHTEGRSLKTPREANKYLQDVARVLKPNGLIMVYDYNVNPEDNEETPEALAKELGAEMIEFDLPKDILEQLAEKMGKGNIQRFEDFFTDSETAEDLPVKARFMRIPATQP